MSKLTGWWKNRGQAAKVELYTRWSFHLFVLIEILSFALTPLAGMGERPGTTEIGLCLAVVTHSVLCGVHSSLALSWVLDRRRRPVRMLAAVVGTTAAIMLAALALEAAGRLGEGVAPGLVAGVSAWGIGSVVLSLKVKQIKYVAPAAGLATAVAVLALGMGVGAAVGFGVAVLVGGCFLAFTCGFSRWLLTAVWELDRSRELQAQLAVAEERLRFGRDLHDVMGRNLAVIALKSELAVQLARRGRPEAVEQMIEVQRIAQESQREVRDVVRGYREADLTVELEGARGVLSAAGIDCRVRRQERRALPPGVQSALGWVVREATTNVLRHGEATSCLIRLAPGDDGSLVLVVENDGVPAEAPGRPGSGLAGLRERLAVLDGTLEAGRVSGGRFRLRAEIPARELQVESRESPGVPEQEVRA
ncbi:sensor histidine kinase [Streptomyces bambusae]|uniref:Sensor histidine kinase n=1 Tax=Streptomyces bambusae TaxID=1550616 RepID=A0ABS6ZEN3_9ACTN|nr:histidine kinase [Streptomyces bambusae]MBW5485181.1 sensor histidine kinase [Streptomyces bambusae]